jgi:hypothetical protein
MINLPYAPFPQEGLLSVGGFTCVNPRAWKNYLDNIFRQYYPSFSTAKETSLKWMENNCILASLEKYLLAEFGALIPYDNLFKLYNEGGEGLPPEQILEAITAVISPLGFEVDKVLVPDAELGAAMGHPDKIVDLSYAEAFDGQAGIGMINIRSGYNHAFFWKKMNKRKFLRSEFRMAVMIKRQHVQSGSLGSLEVYCRLVDERTGQGPSCPLAGELADLLELVKDQADWSNPEFKEKIGLKMEVLRQHKESEELSPVNLLLVEEIEAVVHRIFPEAPE